MDKVVQNTDYDAISCKLSAVSTGYLPCPGVHDGYFSYKEVYLAYYETLKKFLSRRDLGSINRSVKTSFPVMNYGTYLRTVSIDSSLKKMLASGGSVQVVNLGCGSDLRFIHLLKMYDNVKYIDMDYRNALEIKGSVLRNNDRFAQLLNIDKTGDQSDDQSTNLVVTDKYVMLEADLKDTDATISRLLATTDPHAKIIFITECALCYLPDNEAQNLINSLVNIYDNGYWISYDPIGGNHQNNQDRFGTIMQNNLRSSRDLELPTLLKYFSKELYASRFHQDSKTEKDVQVDITTLWDFFVQSTSEDEKLRLKQLQFLDEIEELKIMQSHYIILNAKWQK